MRPSIASKVDAFTQVQACPPIPSWARGASVMGEQK